MNNVLVIGSGVMGSGIAQLLSINKIKTTITDISIENLNRSKEKILFNLDSLLKKSVITNNQKNISIKNINFIKKLDQKINHFDLVLEAANEDYNTKKEIFKMVEKKVSPQCILASNTSSISISEIGSHGKTHTRLGNLTTQDQEKEADLYAVETLNKLNLPTDSIKKFLLILESKSQFNLLDDELKKFSTHPLFKERYEIIENKKIKNSNNFDQNLQNEFNFIKAKFMAYSGYDHSNELDGDEKIYYEAIQSSLSGNLSNSLKKLNILI